MFGHNEEKKKANDYYKCLWIYSMMKNIFVKKVNCLATRLDKLDYFCWWWCVYYNTLRDMLWKSIRHNKCKEKEHDEESLIGVHAWTWKERDINGDIEHFLIL
jgi:hypothetical protein